MAIEFACPKGHRIKCGDDKAGRAGKCPKCGEKFVIPHPGASAPTQLAPGTIALATIEEGSGIGANTIVFLCPNGHKLNGPRSLQGRPGECPHCGSKFRIPDYDEDDEDWSDVQPEDTVVDDDIPLGKIVDDGKRPRGSEPIDLTEIAPIEVSEFPDEAASAAPAPGKAATGKAASSPAATGPAATGTLSPGSGSRPAGPHPLAELFTRLWQEKTHGGVVELHTADGMVLTPHIYSDQTSSGSHGLFAVKDDDGSFTITVVAWDAVTKVSVRRVKRLPKDMF